MHYHPDLATALAQIRAADLRDAASHARGSRVTRGARRTSHHGQHGTNSIVLDAYPRLCGLRVTLERLQLMARTRVARRNTAIADRCHHAAHPPRNLTNPTMHSRLTPFPPGLKPPCCPPVCRLQAAASTLPAAMTTNRDTRPTKSDAIAAHRYALPIVRERISARRVADDQFDAEQQPASPRRGGSTARRGRRLRSCAT